MLDWIDETRTADAAQADLVRTEFFDAVQDVFEEYDLLATSTVTTTGWERNSDNYLAYADILTAPFNWTRHPAASVPAGLTSEGTPAGIHSVAPHYNDHDVVAASATVEKTRPWEHIYSNP